MKTAECAEHAQRCRLAEQTAELAGLEATRRLAAQLSEHRKQRCALWMQYTQELGEAKRVLEAESAAHHKARAAAAIRSVGISPHAAAREQAAAAKLQAVEARYIAEREALRAV